MKKIVLSLAGALAATAFAPEAAAIPAYARQVGMGCTACHAQHFPVLNSFGRAFKAGGFTMMGAQGKVEGEHLSIPDTLNASILMKLRYQKDDTAGVTGSKTSQAQVVGDGQWQFPDEFALLFGGRVAENIGFFLEGNMISGGSLAAGIKLPIVFDVGAAKLSVIPFQTDALGVQFGYELSSGGVMRANRWAEHRRETSAIQYNADRNCPASGVGDCGAAEGFAFVAQSDIGFVNASMYAANQGGKSSLGSTYLRVAATPTVADWAMVVGLGQMSGESFSSAAGAAVQTEQTFIDFQAQGEVGGRELGVYVQQATAPAGTGGLKNSFNTGTLDRKAMTIGADYSVLPHVLSIGAAYRAAETGGAAATNGDDAITVTAVYDMYQNVALHVNHSRYSGTAHDAATAVKSLTTLMLEAAW